MDKQPQQMSPDEQIVRNFVESEIKIINVLLINLAKTSKTDLLDTSSLLDHIRGTLYKRGHLLEGIEHTHVARILCSVCGLQYPVTATDVIRAISYESDDTEPYEEEEQ